MTVLLIFVNETSCCQTVTTTTCDTQGSIVSSNIQGPPGKRGPPGSIGQKGEPGDGFAEFEQIFEKKLRMFREEFNNRIKISNGECFAGMKSGEIADDQIQVSSFWDQDVNPSKANGHHPSHARLDEPGHGWAPLSNDALLHWIGVDFREPRTIQGIILQGRHLLRDDWVTSYKVLYGDDESSLKYISERGSEMVFPGAWDRDSHARVIFAQEIRAQYIRIVPLTWHTDNIIRFEILSC